MPLIGVGQQTIILSKASSNYIKWIEDENVINNREEENIINNSEDEVNSHIKKTIRVDLPPGYKPSQKADTREQYMSLYQLEYFRRQIFFR